MFKYSLKNIQLIFLSLFLIVVAFISLSQPVSAQNAFQLGINNAGAAAAKGGLFQGKIADVLVTVIKFFLSLIGLIAVAAIIYGGFLYVTAIGDEKKSERAKEVIIYAVIGLIVIGAAALITNVVITTFK